MMTAHTTAPTPLWYAERGAGESEAPLVGGERPYRAWTPRGVVASGVGPFGVRRRG